MRVAIVAIALGSMSAPALAHPGGHGEYEEPLRLPVTLRAEAAVARLVAEDKLSPSWSKPTLVGRELRTKNSALQWVVIFRNAAETKREKHMLYVLMTPDGAFISADHELS
jgi:hypothetical protein